MEKLSSKQDLVFLSEPRDVSMADEWFDLATEDHFWMRWRFSVFQSRISRIFAESGPKKKCLEIGCGNGQFIRQVKNQMKDISIDGCDLNTYALKKISGMVNGQIYVYDIFSRHPDMIGKYDIIFLMDVIEHIDNDFEFLEAATAHLKVGGLVVINVPALSRLFSKYDNVAGHKRRYTVASIETLFARAKVYSLDVRYWGFLLLPIAFFRKYYLNFVPDKNVIKRGFNPRFRLVTLLMNYLMRLELRMNGLSLPGTSVLAIGRKLD